MKEKPRPGSRSDYSDRGLASLGRAAVSGVSALLAAFGMPNPLSLFGGRVSAAVAREAEYARIKVNKLEAKGLISRADLEGEHFAFRVNQIVSEMARTAQAEKRRYLSNALLNIACANVDEDDATLLLGLMEPLSLRHLAILKYITEHSTGDRAGNMSWLPDELKRSVVREAVMGIVPVSFFPSLVLDLQGRGLIQPTEPPDKEDDVLKPLPIAHLLIQFIAEPDAPQQT